MAEKKEIYIVKDTHIRHGETGKKPVNYGPGDEIKLTADEAKNKSVILKSETNKIVVETEASGEIKEQLAAAEARIAELEAEVASEKKRADDAEAKVAELEAEFKDAKKSDKK